MYSSQLSNFSSFTLNFILHVIKLFSLKPSEVGAPAFGWGIRSHFPIGFCGFSYQAAAQKRFSPRGNDLVVYYSVKLCQTALNTLAPSSSCTPNLVYES